MITAPSWSGVRGEKIVRSRSAETSAWIMTPVSATSSRPVSRSRTMSAPWPSAESSAGGVGDLVGDVLDGALLGRREEPVERADAPDPLERAPQLRLEDDDEREQSDDRAGLEDLGQELEPEEAGPPRTPRTGRVTPMTRLTARVPRIRLKSQ